MPKRKKKKGKGEIVDWDIWVNEKDKMYFSVRLEWENQIVRQFTYYFNTEEDFWKRWDMFKKQHPTKQILQELFDEVIHSYAGGRMLRNSQLAEQNRKEQSGIQKLADDSFVEQWLSMSSMRELRN